MSIRYNEEFHRAKESLLKYYSDIQVSLGARLIGLSVALFALVEAFKNFNSEGLSVILGQNLSTNQFFAVLKLIILFHGILLLMVLMVRSIFRYASVSGFCNKIQVLPPFGVNENTIVHAQVAYRAYKKMFDDKGECTEHVFFCFPISYFLEGYRGSSEGADDNRRRDTALGWFWATVFGFIITVSLFLLIA